MTSVPWRADPEAEVLAGGAALRLLALGAASATAAIAVGGAAGLDGPHRALTPPALALLVALTVSARLVQPRLLPAAALALAALLAEAGIGAWIALQGAGRLLDGAHEALAVLAFAATAQALRRSRQGAAAPRGRAADYVTLTKPRVMSLLLVTGACGTVVGARGAPSAAALITTLAGLALSCGGAAAINHYLDRDLDRFMHRTDARPVAAQRLPPSRALEFGVALSALGFVVLDRGAGLVAALLAVAGGAFYVVVYTGWLKRRTTQNIVIGGAAGAVPPLVGYAAASGRVTPLAVSLFLIVFVWTPPHFWSLALLIRGDYAAAGVPMLPVVRGDDETTRQILAYSLGLVAVSLLPALSPAYGGAYAVCAAVLGAVFLLLAWRLRRQPTRRRAGRLFHFSLAYLAALFVALAVLAAV